MKKLLSACVIAALFVGVSVSAMAQDKPKEKASAEDRFKRLDTNSDMKLSEEEFVAAAKGDQGKADKAKTRFARMDTNGDKALSLDEFKAGDMKKKDK